MPAPDLRARLLAALAERGLLAADGVTTIYGQPAWRAIVPGHEPEALMAATALQRRLAACAYATPACGTDLCAAWVENVFAYLGFCRVQGSAAELCESYCSRTDLSDLKVGMLVAVPRAPYGTGSRAHGHVGLYVGDGRVRDCVGGRVRTVPLELWLSAYGVMAAPRWGWLGSIALDELAGCGPAGPAASGPAAQSRG